MFTVICHISMFYSFQGSVVTSRASCNTYAIPGEKQHRSYDSWLNGPWTLHFADLLNPWFILGGEWWWHISLVTFFVRTDRRSFQIRRNNFWEKQLFLLGFLPGVSVGWCFIFAPSINLVRIRPRGGSVVGFTLHPTFSLRFLRIAKVFFKIFDGKFRLCVFF